MIPVLWRYLLGSYFKVFFLTVGAFVSVLIVSRFKEIARFAALCGDLLKTGLFTLYQIPGILPLAIPISALLASLLLFQRLSGAYELTALRASGVSLRTIAYPLLFAAAFLSLLNFALCAEVAPYCRRESKTLLYQETSANPLLLMQRQNLVKIKRAYLNMDVKKDGKAADDVILIAHNESNHRLGFFAARQLRINKENLLGYDVAMISYLQSENTNDFDPLLIENQASMSTAAPVLSDALKKNRPKLEPAALSLRMLRQRLLDGGKEARASRIEILRRITLTFSVFSFTLLGCAFGIQAGRVPKKRGLILVFLLSLSVLMSYLFLKKNSNPISS